MTVSSGGGKGRKSAAEALATDPSEDGGQDKVNGKTTELGVNQFQQKIDEIWEQYDTNESGVLER